MLFRFSLAFLASIVVVPHAVAQSELPARCKFAEVGRLPLRYHGQTLALTTDGNINGLPAVLMLDTGAYDNVITPMGAAKRNLRMSPRGDTVMGTGGLSRLYDVPIRNFDVGPIRYAEAIALRQRALESDPFDLAAQLELFAVRTRAGQVQAAKDELNQVVSRQDDPHWPRSVADYYLGKLTLEDLLETAGEPRDMARYRRCDVYRYAGALLEARGDTHAAASLRIRQGEECGADRAAAPR